MSTAKDVSKVIGKSRKVARKALKTVRKDGKRLNRKYNK